MQGGSRGKRASSRIKVLLWSCIRAPAWVAPGFVLRPLLVRAPQSMPTKSFAPAVCNASRVQKPTAPAVNSAAVWVRSDTQCPVDGCVRPWSMIHAIALRSLRVRQQPSPCGFSGQSNYGHRLCNASSPVEDPGHNVSFLSIVEGPSG